MKVIADKIEQDYLSAKEAIQYESGTFFRCQDGTFFIVVTLEYNLGSKPDKCKLVGLSPCPFILDENKDTGYNKFWLLKNFKITLYPDNIYPDLTERS